ncbi:hypothetical protein IMX26_17675 [Clostridium sp. 'deep sea']|uniref:DUF4026 domain-containing protein n=1 Tax=Clostridium sp. 'deep sea' TaxID=2779445 RepID=UPI0018967297|nr:hypothetical protein [Clostridium sp. 'deep sea']QOR35257.1 hypothetical protein IMX26_17675 [Clostridium sp. 'deep sea']
MLKEIKSLSMTREQELSYMQAIPSSNDLLLDKSKALAKLNFSSEFSKIIYLTDTEVQFEYKGKTFTAYIYTSHITKDLLKPVHIMTDIETKRVEACYKGLVVGLMFSDDYIESYFMQLKLLMTMVPNAVAIADYSSFELLSGRWAKLQVESNIVPSINYLFRIDVEKVNDELWIHSHGLKRCCGLDFEAFNVPKGQDKYPELAIIKELCNKVINRRIDFKSNLLTEINTKTSILLEYGEDYYKYNKIDIHDRPEYHDQYAVIQLVTKENNEYHKKPLSFIREIDSNYLTELMKYKPELQRTISQQKINYLVDYANQYVAYVNYNKEQYDFLKVIEIKQDSVIASSTKDENKEPEIFKLADINDWYLHVDGYIIAAEDVYYLINKSDNLSPIITNNREALKKQLLEWHHNGESDKIVDLLAKKSNLDLELSNIYAKALNNVGEYTKAIDILLLVREFGKENADWYYNISFAHGSLNSFKKALKIIDEGLLKYPNHLPLLKEKAINIMYNSEYEQAKKIVENIIVDENKNSYFTEGEVHSLYNILENCDYHINKKQQEEHINKIKLLYNNGMYKKINSLLLGSEVLSNDLGYMYANSLAEVGNVQEAITLLNSFEEKDLKWHDVICELLEKHQLDKDLKIYKHKKQKLKEKLVQEQNDELLNKVYTMSQNNNFLNVYINNVNEVVLLLNSSHQLVRDAVDKCYEQYNNYILYMSNFAELLKRYITQEIKSDFNFEATVEKYYNIIKFTAEATAENISITKKAANELYDLIMTKNLAKAIKAVADKVNWQDYDTTKIYDLQNDLEYDEFLFVIDDLHNTFQYEKQVKLFENQAELDMQLKQKYVCALNNNKNYHKALELLHTMQAADNDDYYINYLLAYAHIGNKDYFKSFEYCGKTVSYLKNGMDQEDSILLCAFGLVHKGDLEQAKQVLADINMEADAHRFEFKHGLDYLLNKEPDLRISFRENMIARKAERLIKDENKEQALKLIKNNDFTDQNAINSIYYALIELEQYNMAYKYLNLIEEKGRTDYWKYCKLCCLVFMSKYEEALNYSDKVYDYLENCYYDFELKSRPLIVYGYSLFAKKDMLKIKQILFKLWGSELEQYRNLKNLYEQYCNTSLTNNDYEIYKQDMLLYS